MMPVDPAAFRSKYIWLILQEFRYLKNNGIAIWNHVPKSEVTDFFSAFGSRRSTIASGVWV